MSERSAYAEGREAGEAGLRGEIADLRRELAEYELSFDFNWRSRMEAIKRWQRAHPGKDLVWPDHTDLCVWLMEQFDQERERREKAEALLREVRKCITAWNIDPRSENEIGVRIDAALSQPQEKEGKR